MSDDTLTAVIARQRVHILKGYNPPNATPADLARFRQEYTVCPACDGATQVCFPRHTAPHYIPLQPPAEPPTVNRDVTKSHPCPECGQQGVVRKETT